MYSSRVSEGAATSRRGIFNSLRRAAGRCNPLQCGRCVNVSDRNLQPQLTQQAKMPTDPI